MILAAAGGAKPTHRAMKEFDNLKLSIDELIMSAFRLDIKNYIHQAVEERTTPLHQKTLECLDKQSKADHSIRKVKEDFLQFRQ